MPYSPVFFCPRCKQTVTMVTAWRTPSGDKARLWCGHTILIPKTQPSL